MEPLGRCAWVLRSHHRLRTSGLPQVREPAERVLRTRGRSPTTLPQVSSFMNSAKGSGGGRDAFMRGEEHSQAAPREGRLRHPAHTHTTNTSSSETGHL